MATSDNAETRCESLWFGLRAKVTIGPGLVHKSGFGAFTIPHPPIVNWLLRKGLSCRSNRDLSFAHEFAHFRTAPLLLLYLLIVLIVAYARNRMTIGVLFLLMASVQAVWEMASESLVKLRDPEAYRSAYRVMTRFPRTLFWTTAGMLAVAGWLVVLRN